MEARGGANQAKESGRRPVNASHTARLFDQFDEQDEAERWDHGREPPADAGAWENLENANEEEVDVADLGELLAQKLGDEA